jgi:rubredoxin-NAD+ reductase
MSRVVIIGTGLAGYLLAKEIRALSDCPITLITKNQGNYYTKPGLSHLIRQNKRPENLVMKTPEAMAEDLKLDILVEDQVMDIDTQSMSVLCKNQSVQYTQLVFAVGAEPKFPREIDYHGKRPLVVNHLEDWQALGQSLDSKGTMAVMGGGLVGSEFAHDVSGAQSVDWIFSESWPLSRFVPFQVGHWFKTNMEALGIRVIQGRIDSVSHDDHYQVKVSGASYPYDTVFQAFGLGPVTDIAIKAGVNCQLGICVDRFLRTNQPNIFAMGDCAEMDQVVLQYVAPIRIQAKALASTLCGHTQPVTYPAMTCVVKTPMAPVAFCIPPNREGVWEIQACKDSGVKAVLKDGQAIIGFAVCGSYAKERMVLSRMMPDFLPPLNESSK